MTSKSSTKYLTYLPSQDNYLNNMYRKFDFEEKVDMENFMPVKFENVDVSIVNGLRRICISEIKNLAFSQFDDQKNEKIKIKTNTSQYHREVLIDRLGFITINMDFVETKKLEAKDLEFMLCDPNDTEKPLKNTSTTILKVQVQEHLKVYYKGKELDIVSLCPYNSLLLTLNPSEEIYVVMSPTIDVGRHHPRWQSSYVMYKFATQYDLNPSQKIETNKEQMEYIGHDTRKPNSIIFTIESNGKMKSRNVLTKGIEVLKNKLDITRLKLLSNEIAIESDVNMPTFAKLTFVDEDHTLGQILEYVCLNKIKELITTAVQNLIKSGKLSPDNREKEEMNILLECLCGYRKSHPLDNHVELIIRTPIHYNFMLPQSYNQFATPIGVVIMSIESTINLCEQLLNNVSTLKS